MRTTVAMPQGKPVANRVKLAQLLKFLMGKSTRMCGRQWGDVSLVLTDDVGMRRLNSLHLGHTDTTDVITYFYDPIPGVPAHTTSGEIFVNVELARRVGVRYGGASRELALYIAHGCDHLAGEDDCTPDKRRRMRRRELRWLTEASRHNLLTGLIAL